MSAFSPSPSPSPSPAPAPALAPAATNPPAPSLATQGAFAAAQRADRDRLPWGWATRGKNNDSYAPAITGKWWSHSGEQLGALGSSKRSDVGHIGRIMETELGEELLGVERCAACQEQDQKCWVYSRKGAQQVSRPGSTCARCRL